MSAVQVMKATAAGITEQVHSLLFGARNHLEEQRKSIDSRIYEMFRDYAVNLANTIDNNYGLRKVN